MEKRQLMKNLLFLFFLIPGMTFAQETLPDIIVGQGRIIDLDQDNGTLEVYSIECEPYIQVSVNLTNLDKIDGGFGIPLGTLLPSDGNALFLHYQIGSLVGQQELDNTFSYSFSIGENLKIYSKIFEFPLNSDVFLSCISGMSLPAEFKIINATGSPAPLFYYGNSGNIFDCIYFMEIDCNCTTPQSCPGENGSEIVWDDKFIDAIDFCEKCGLQEGPIEGRSNKNIDSDVVFFPNPFTENTKLELAITESAPVEVVIFDVSGKIISSWEEYASMGDYSKVLDTSNWQYGIYFAKVRIGSNTKSIKMIKVE